MRSIHPKKNEGKRRKSEKRERWTGKKEKEEVGRECWKRRMIQNEKEGRRRKKNLCKKSKLLSNGEKKRVQTN